MRGGSAEKISVGERLRESLECRVQVLPEAAHFSLKMALLGEFIALCCVDCFGSLLVDYFMNCVLFL